MGRPSEPDAIRNLPQTNVRLATELREALMRQATINGRSLNMEISTRLRDSLAGDGRGAYRGAHATGERAPPLAEQQLSDAQRMLLKRYEALTPDKQLALLQLLAP